MCKVDWLLLSSVRKNKKGGLGMEQVIGEVLNNHSSISNRVS